jgi:hypothetical protein
MPRSSRSTSCRRAGRPQRRSMFRVQQRSPTGFTPGKPRRGLHARLGRHAVATFTPRRSENASPLTVPGFGGTLHLRPARSLNPQASELALSPSGSSLPPKPESDGRSCDGLPLLTRSTRKRVRLRQSNLYSAQSVSDPISSRLPDSKFLPFDLGRMEFNKFLKRELNRIDEQPDDIIKATALQAERVLKILRGSEPTRQEQRAILEFLNGADRTSPQHDPAATVVSTTA